jgi:hypothetical protein
MDSISWNEAKEIITREQFNNLDVFNDSVKDGKIDKNIWESVLAMKAEAKNNNDTVKTNNNPLLENLASLLGLVKYEETESQTTTASESFSNTDLDGNGVASAQSTRDLQNEFVQEGERALKFFKQNGSLDGFNLNAELIKARYKVEIVTETLYDDASNDIAVAKKLNDGSYAVELEEVSDGLKIVIKYTKEDTDESTGITVRNMKIIESIDRSTVGTEAIKKPNFGID